MIKFYTSVLSIFFLSLLLSVKVVWSAQDVILKKQVNIYTSATKGSSLYKAVEALQRDIEKTTALKSQVFALSSITASGIIIIDAQKDKLLVPLKGWEKHSIYQSKVNEQPHIILQGADLRGTIYAIYSFSENVLGVPPLWYYANWQPKNKRKELIFPANFKLNFNSPEVKYRAWFPNDMDLLEPWRKLSKDNNEMWLETALRLKLNTIEWLDAGERDFSLKYSVSPTSRLIHEFGLINTTHHHSSLNASFENWEDYWQKVRNQTAPELSLSNKKYIIEYWRYNIETAHKAGLDMIWVLGFRGAGDRPFWDTFKDAPKTMKERGEVINKMMKTQRNLVVEITKNPKAQFRAIFYDELSDLLAQGYIGLPEDPKMIWNFVAARRDHYPNDDIRNFKVASSINLGYYFNYQFTSTGSHIAAAEGPWKMEQNFRYIAQKSDRPLLFSVVNAGNIREHVMELAANAAMMWNFKSYNSDKFLLGFCEQYYGKQQAQDIAKLYRGYYESYWNPKKTELKYIDRQFIFQDLRYKRAIVRIAEILHTNDDPNPLKDVVNEQLPGRTFRIVPKDYGFTNQVETIIDGTSKSSNRFLQVAQSALKMSNNLPIGDRAFLNDNLIAPAYFMHYTNETLLNLTMAYQLQKGNEARRPLVEKALEAMKKAQSILDGTTHSHFTTWYQHNQKFNPREVALLIEKSLNKL